MPLSQCHQLLFLCPAVHALPSGIYRTLWAMPTYKCALAPPDPGDLVSHEAHFVPEETPASDLLLCLTPEPVHLIP